MWSEQRENDRQAAVGRLLYRACQLTTWTGDVLTRYHALRNTGSLSDAICALIEAGDTQPRPTEFWATIRKAAELLWLDHPWATSNAEHTRRMQYLAGLTIRIEGWPRD